jgi:alternative squalene epoxidase
MTPGSAYSNNNNKRCAPGKGGGNALQLRLSVGNSSSSVSGVNIRSLSAWLLWPLLLTIPLLLSSPYSFTSYATIFPSSWYEYNNDNDNYNNSNTTPKPLGLFLGILAVAVGQVWVWIFFYLYKYHYSQGGEPEPRSIQQVGARPYTFSEGLMTHISQPEGFVVLIGYLSITWMFQIMPPSYYSFSGSIQYPQLFACLVCQEAIQFVMHYLEHVVSPTFYQYSHKPHHRFTNPRLFDAFNGSLPDTICMIIIPLICTAQIVRNVNVWTYMAFGSTYASWLTLIHSEYVLPWDATFRQLGFGTPADHHVHHKFFIYNYGHLFTWFDRLAGTYRDPQDFAPRVFRENV